MRGKLGYKRNSPRLLVLRGPCELGPAEVKVAMATAVVAAAALEVA